MATRPKTTTLADDTALDKPQTTSAGDAPADTFDPKERASSARPDKAAAAKGKYASVNAVVAVDPVPESAATDVRQETYEQTGPDGKVYTVTHHIDTGKSTKAPKD